MTRSFETGELDHVKDTLTRYRGGRTGRNKRQTSGYQLLLFHRGKVEYQVKVRVLEYSDRTNICSLFGALHIQLKEFTSSLLHSVLPIFPSGDRYDQSTWQHGFNTITVEAILC